MTRLNEKGYRYGWHFFPHDVQAKDMKGRTFLADLQAAGLVNARIVQRTEDVWIGINHLRSLFPRLTMRMPQCEEGLNRLEAYRVSVLIDQGRSTDIPVHDKTSHASDALRVLAEADLAGMVAEGWVKSCFSAEGMKKLRRM